MLAWILVAFASSVLASPEVEGELAKILAPWTESLDGEALGRAIPIENPKGKNALKHFYLKVVDALGEGKNDPERGRIRVLVWGASHVASDLFTGYLRNLMKGQFGDGGIGLVVPASPWRDYYNRDANISYSKHWKSSWVSRKHNRDDGRYGLAGISFESANKSAWAKVSTAKVAPYGREIDRLEVWYWADKKAGDFWVIVDGKKRHRVKTRVVKDEPGFRAWTLELPLGPHEVEIRPVGNGLVTLFGVVLDKSGPGLIMDSLGINGSRATSQLEWDAGIFTAQLQRRKPDLLMLVYGTNSIGDDTPLDEYERRLDLVVNRVRTASKEASCLFVGPSDRPIRHDVDEESFAELWKERVGSLESLEEQKISPKNMYLFEKRPRQAEVIDIQKKVAWRYGCGYWDWADAMGGDLSMLSWVHAEPRLAKYDYVHLTREGYFRIGQLFYDALMGAFEAMKH